MRYGTFRFIKLLTITYLLYQLRFCKSFDLVSKFYECVELGYNPFRVCKTPLERTMVKNLVKIIDSRKEVFKNE